jgi:hypothetical protein
LTDGSYSYTEKHFSLLPIIFAVSKKHFSAEFSFFLRTVSIYTVTHKTIFCL